MKTSNGSLIISRREFAVFSIGVVGSAVRGFTQSTTLTAGQVIERIKDHFGVPWRGGPTDTFKAGDLDSPVRGIATTVMSTFDVIKRAAAAGKNMVITHEPTFWPGNDDVRNFTDDPVYQKKMQFILENNVVIWRFHDHLHAWQPDMTAVGLAEALGWDKYASKDEQRIYVLPPVKLRELATDVEKRFRIPEYV